MQIWAERGVELAYGHTFLLLSGIVDNILHTFLSCENTVGRMWLTLEYAGVSERLSR